MAHELIHRLWMARAAFIQGLDGVTEDEAVQRLGKLNSISWLVGHKANFEQRMWVEAAQGKTVNEAVKVCGGGLPPATPPLADMVNGWQAITTAADTYLTPLTAADLAGDLIVEGRKRPENIGTLILRMTYHYWFHLGEMQAVRQMLGHDNLTQYIGAIPPEAQVR